MNHDSSTDSGLPIDGSPPSESWLFAQVLYGKPLPRIVSPEAKAKAKREELERLAPFSTLHAEELRGLQAAEAAARHDRKLWEWCARISTQAEETLRTMQCKEAAEREAWRRAERFVESRLADMTEWDEADHPRAPQGQSDGGQWVAKGGSGSAQHSDHAGAASEPVAVDQHSAPTEMLELANTWWQTNGVLQQYRRDIERLPARIANGQAQLGSGGRHADIRARNLAKDQQDLATATALAPQLEEQLRALEQIYRDAGYDKVEYSTWTPGETLISGRGIEEVGRAFEMGGSPAGLKPTGIEIDLALAAGAVLQLGKALLGKTLGKATPSIRFGQQKISSTFRNGDFAGQSIEDVAAGLRSGAIKPSQLPLQTINRDGVTYTLNNRSLMALRLAGKKPSVFIDVTGKISYEKELTKRLREMGGQVPSDFTPVIRRGGKQ